MTKPTDNPGQGQSNKPDSPPGHEEDPGRGQEGAPGQNKPKPDQGLPEDQPYPDQGLPDPEAQPKK